MRIAMTAILCAGLLAPGVASADDRGLWGARENTSDTSAAVESSTPGLGGIKIGGYLRPELVGIYRGEAAPRDRYEYGIGTSRAGILFGGEPIEQFHVSIHIKLGSNTGDVVSDVDTVDQDGDGIPDEVETETSLGAGVEFEKALATWQPDPRFALTIGRRKVPFTATASTSSNQLLFPDRIQLHDAFAKGTDLGIFTNVGTADKKLQATVGVWNGSGRESEFMPEVGRGFLTSARIDYSPIRPFPFEEGDLHREPLRVSIGAGAIYRALTLFDDAGFEGSRQRDLRASASVRVAARGFFFQTEVMRRQVTDNLSSRPDVATAAYAQVSYYFLAGTIGLAPMARAGLIREDQHVAPSTGGTLEAGISLHPKPLSDRPDHLRLATVYIAEQDAITGEGTHQLVTQLRLRW